MTLKMIKLNEQVWAENTINTFQIHYDEAINKELPELSLYWLTDLSAPFQIAAKWARRNMGRHFKQQTLDEADRLIKDGSKREETTSSSEGGHLIDHNHPLPSIPIFTGSSINRKTRQEG